MIDVDIINSRNSQPASVHLKLPASSEKEAKAKTFAGTEDLSKCELRIHWPEELSAVAEGFEKIPRGEHFWKELNIFAQRLGQLDDYDRQVLNGAWAIHRPTSMKTAIGLTYHLDEIVTMEGIYTAEDFGRLMVEEELVDVPEDAESCSDFAKIGAEYMADNACAIVNGIYYEDLEPEIKVIYESQSFPLDVGSMEPQSPAAEPKVIATVHLENQVLEKENVRVLSATLELPVKQADIEKTMRELRMRHNTENGEMSVEWNKAYYFLDSISHGCQDPSNLGDLNALTQRIHNMTVVEDAQFSYLGETDWPSDHGKQLDRTIEGTFDLIRRLSQEAQVLFGIADSAALGRYCIENDLLPDFVGLPERVYQRLDYKWIGSDYCRSLRGLFHQGNFIYNLPSFEQLRAGMEVAEQAPQEPEMGGM